MKFNLSLAIQILERSPGALSQMLTGLDHSWLYTNEGENSWSPFDIIGHLIHGEKTDWIPRAKIILSASGNKTFEPFDRFAQFQESQGKDIISLLNTFSELRSKNLLELKSLNLDENDLDKTGIHPELGPVNLRQLLATWVTHDLGHIAQVSRVMAKQYRNDVGPWLAYIPILDR